MKKLLLVLAVVAMSSFLLVGCLGTGTTPDPDPDPDPTPDPEPTVTITSTNWYSDPLTLKNYVPGSDTVTVTFSEAVEDGYGVQLAVKWWDASEEEYVYLDNAWATSSTDGKVWTVTYPFNDLDESVLAGYLAADYILGCEPICLVALVKHPCCPAEEVAMEVVYIDDVAPEVIPTITVKDCDPCEVVDICDPVIGGAYFEFTTIVVDDTDPCDIVTTDNCDDDCSGVGAWRFVVDEDECDECPTASGIGCTVVGATDCGCLPYADTGTVVYVLTFDVEDNVGNEQDTMTWEIIVDTDEVISTTPI